MDFETAINTQRLRLLRLIAGLAVLIGVLSVGPVSRGFSVWSCRFVGSILSRAETAARYLVIAHAHKMVADNGMAMGHSQISESLIHAFAADDADLSPSECRRRLKVLRAVLMDLPRCARRLLRRIEKLARCAGQPHRSSPCRDFRLSAPHCDWRLVGPRIERPPDYRLPIPPALATSPRNSGGRLRRMSQDQGRV